MSSPHITCAPGIPLSPDEQQIVEAMFAGYARVSVHRQFTSGRSGSRVLGVRPVRQDARPELEAVIKLDTADRIAREVTAFREYIQRQIPHVAGLDGDPVYVADNPLGGLRYPLAGSGIFPVVSFLELCQGTDAATVVQLLTQRLLPGLRPLWRQHEVVANIPLAHFYDSFLPPNLTVRWQATPSADVTPQRLTPFSPHLQNVTVDDWVVVDGFAVTRIDTRLVVDVPEKGYRIAFVEVPDLARFTVGETLERPLCGLVVQTRQGFLAQEARRAIGPLPGLNEQQIRLPSGDLIGNPFTAVARYLYQTRTVYRSAIHGDLNTQNILAEQQGQQVTLIDFVMARQDHAIRDLLHLEMAVLNELVPGLLEKQFISSRIMTVLMTRLHTALRGEETAVPAGLEMPFAVLLAIRHAAVDLMYERGDWSEYYQGLLFYLVGAFRYASVRESPLTMQVLFWSASAVTQLLETPDLMTYASPDKPAPSPGQNSPAITVNGPATLAGDVHISGGMTYFQGGSEAGSETAVSRPSSNGGVMNPFDKRQFVEQIKHNFNRTELTILCNQMGINPDEIPGRSFSEFVWEMVNFCERRSWLPELREACRRERPSIDW